MNGFIKANSFDPRLGNTYTENGALSYGTFGSEIMNQFGHAGSARGREMSQVWEDQNLLWAEDSAIGLMFPFYLRLITRKTDINGTKTQTPQRGAGNRDESFKRLLWIANYHPNAFYDNIWLLPVIGTWRDLWDIMVMAHDNNIKIDHSKLFDVIVNGLNNQSTCMLVKKYLPSIKSNNKCTTSRAATLNYLAKMFASRCLHLSYSEYRKMKATNGAQHFQTVICARDYDAINWNEIPGKALLKLATGKFLERHDLEGRFIDWLDSKNNVTFNGFPYELVNKVAVNNNIITKRLVDKQFEYLVSVGKEGGGAINGNVLCALDTSGSMTSPINEYGTTSYDVCIGLGVYFAEMNQGAFHNVVAMFDDTSELMTLKGTFSDKILQIRHARTAWGSTNFQSLIDLIVKTRKLHPEIPVEEFPQTLLVVSDMQFNPSSSYYNYSRSAQAEQTNYETAMDKLREVFPSEFVDGFKIVWWQCANRNINDFPSNMECGGTYVVSGFDGAVISFILGGEVNETTKNNKIKTMEEIIAEVFSQYIFNYMKF